MKMTLEFNLPEDEVEASHAMNVDKLYSAIFQFNQVLRNISKHSDDEDESKRADWAQELLYKELEGIRDIFEI